MATTRKNKLPVVQSKYDKLPSAYTLYFRDTVNAIKQKNPKYSAEELSLIVASKWEVLDPVYKAIYQEKTELAKRKYLLTEAMTSDTLLTDGNGKSQTMDQIAASQGESPDAQQMGSSVEDESLPECIRKNCNKRVIMNPDWEDGYCSKECEAIHCREVFNEWLRSGLD